MNSCAPAPCFSPVTPQGLTFFFGGGTEDTDPGAGQLRYNNITQASTTQVYIDFATTTGANIQSYIENMALSTSAVLGQLYILKANIIGRGHVFNVSSVTLESGYAVLDVVIVDELGGPNPLFFGDTLVLFFIQNGDAGTPGGPQGATGAAGPQGPQGPSGSAGGSSAPNNTTNNSITPTGQTPELPGATAGISQTMTMTLNQVDMFFVVTFNGQAAWFTACYASANISTMSDPSGLFAPTSGGVGMYVYKSANSYEISIQNLTGSSGIVEVKVRDCGVTSATPWA